ncbi:hypothetical protein BCR39DRAFT_535920 [Naematelia encephala]|uniref:Uncharacterized protein n=1 Tax=Naematelia encephala TaxID=71784 RepID=A0A1Y2B0D2_9TREE|nr:hypothetical protein BCR39DRAFT_535920 [Naematelia encephala]
MSVSASSFRIEDMFSVAGTTVLVTGGGSGLGKSISAAFATNGAKVIIVGRRKAVLEATAKEIGGDVVCIQGDVSSKQGVEAIMKEVGEVTCTLDTLVNCAGISIPWKNPSDAHEDPDVVSKMMSEVDDADWTMTNNINVNAPYFMTTFAVPFLRKSDNPSVIIISSVAGLANQRANGSFTYGVSKAAAVHLSSMLAGRLHPMKIRVNCICPGLFPTEMTAQKGQDGELTLGRMGTKAAMRSTIGRPGKPQEMAAPVLLLASKGGHYLNDVCLNVDGGRWLVMKGIYDGIHLPEETYID